MAAIKIGVGPLAVTRQAPAWMSPFQLALDFKAGRYQLNRQQVGLSRIDSLYHTRASARRAEDSAGVSREFGNGAMALTDRGYDSREGWTVLNADPLNPRAWPVESGGTKTDAPGTYLGMSSAAFIASNGASFHRLRTVIPNDTIVAGASYAVRARYFGGSSPWARVHLRCVTTSQDVQVKGPVGALAVSATSAGSVSNLINRDLGGGVFECSFVTTITASGSVWNLAIGPDSEVAGQTVGVVAAQITPTAYQMPWGSGTVAPDTLVIPSTDAGIGANPWAEGGALVMVWRGRAFNAASGTPRILDIGSDLDNRLSLYFDKATSGVRGSARTSAASSLFVAGGAISEGAEGTVVAVWGSDGSIRARWGAAANSIGSRPVFATDVSAIGIGCSFGGSERTNAQTRVAAVGTFASISDAEILTLWQQLAAA